MNLTYIDPYFFYDADRMPESPVVMEIGVFTANTSRVLLSRYPKARVVLIEADPANFAELARVTAGMQVERHHLALAETDAACKVYHYGCEYCHSTFPRHEKEGLALYSTAMVQGYSLRGMLDALQIGCVDLLNLNCEGAEIHALRALCDDEALSARVEQVCTSFHCDHISLYPKSVREDLCARLSERYATHVGNFKEIPYYLFTRKR